MHQIRFGVDGIRDIAGRWPFIPAVAVRIGQALGMFVRESGNSTAVIGRDTRSSGQVLADCLVGGLTSQGVDVCDLGIMPTPGVAFLTKQQEAGLGIVVTASHNPAEYNGLKLFAKNGLRFQQDEESRIETLINAYVSQNAVAYTSDLGTYTCGHHLIGRYIQDHIRHCPTTSLEGFRVVLDCANGAASLVAPAVFGQLGATVNVINDTLNGAAINYLCGSEHARRHPDDLVKMMIMHNADYGFAFDGDGDRLLVVDIEGHVFDGDDFLFILAKALHVEEIVTIAEANRGLQESLSGLGVATIEVPKGDRNIENMMGARGKKRLGGEPGGNIIFDDNHHTVADAIYTAVVLAAKLIDTPSVSLREWVAGLHKYPQAKASIELSSPLTVDQRTHLDKCIAELKLRLGEGGRIKAYNSETEPGVMRVLVEGGGGSQPETVREITAGICEIIRSFLHSEAVDFGG